MSRLVFTCLVLVLTCLVPTFAQDGKTRVEGKTPQWTVLSVEVSRPQPTDVKGALGRVPGVQADLLLHVPGRIIVGIKERTSKVTRFVDDKNLDLMKRPANDDGLLRREGLLDDLIECSNDARHILIPVEAPAWPSKGASKLRIQGTVVLLVGRDEMVVEKKDVTLANGVELGAAAISKLRDPARPPGAKTKASKSSSNQQFVSAKPFKSLAFLDAEGKELPILVPRRLLFEKDLSPTYSATFSARKEIQQRCTAVRLTYFNSVDTLSIPFDLEVGLGLP